VGQYSTLDLDAEQKPHIVYVYYSGHLIRYARKTETGWTFSEFEEDDDVEIDVAMALDGAGHPHVSYWDGIYYGEAHDLKYGYFDGTEWHTTLVDAPGDVGRGSSIAVDSRNHPHIAYYDETNSALKYAYFDGSHWNVTTLDDFEFISFNFRTSIAIDAQDHVHIAYSTAFLDGLSDTGVLKYALLDGATWSISVIDQAPLTQDFRLPAIAIDAGGYPHVTYVLYYNIEAITPDLKYARLDPTGWHVEFVDLGDIVDSENSNSIDIDTHGTPHVAYSVSGTLYHGVGPTAPSGVDDRGSLAGDGLAGVWLSAPYPNPCRDTAVIGFRLGESGDVSLELLDIAGRRVATVARGPFAAGEHVVELRGLVRPGVYLCRLTAGGEERGRKLMVR
jgi:hypothetical protein